MGILDNNVVNPTKKYIQFSGATGEFTVYNKETKEKEVVPMPITFIALKDKITVSGGTMDSDGKFKSVYSNIISSINDDLVVKTGQQAIARGKWLDIKAAVKLAGGKYTVMAYALMNDEVVCFKLAGAALGCWFDKGAGDKITFDGTEDNKTGAIEYKTPKLTTKGLSDKEIEEIKNNKEVKAFEEFSQVDVKLEEKDETVLDEFNENLEKKTDTVSDTVSDIDIDLVPF